MAPRMLTEEVVLASQHLGERDRALVRAVYERGLAIKAVAAITHTSSGRVHRRLGTLVRRVRSPLFRLVLREQSRWPDDRRAIAEAFVCKGQSQREIARSLGLSLHRVRTEIEHLKALAGVSGGGGGRGGRGEID